MDISAYGTVSFDPFLLRYKHQDMIYKYYIIFRAGNKLIMRCIFSYLNITQFNALTYQSCSFFRFY